MQDIVLATIKDVESLRRRPSRLAASSSVRISHPDLRPVERVALESRLSRLANVCGCEAGAFSALLATLAVGLSWWQLELAFNWRAVFLSFGCVIAALFLGKQVHLAIARVQLWRLLSALQRLFAA